MATPKDKHEERILSLTTKAWDGDTAAFFELTSLAENGDAMAQNNVGMIYRNGKGGLGAAFPAAAFHWYTLAAEQGDVSALSNLAFMHYNGMGTDRNLDEARVWYEKAAMKGCPQSMKMLAELQEKTDPSRALAWLMHALLRETRDIFKSSIEKARIALESSMSAADQEQALVVVSELGNVIVDDF